MTPGTTPRGQNPGVCRLRGSKGPRVQGSELMACRLRRLSAAAHSAHPIYATAPHLRKILDRGAGKVPSRATRSRRLPVAGAMTAGKRAAMRRTRKKSAGGKGRPAGDGAGRCAFRCLRAPGHQRKCPAEAGHWSCRLCWGGVISWRSGYPPPRSPHGGPVAGRRSPWRSWRRRIHRPWSPVASHPCLRSARDSVRCPCSPDRS